MLRIRAYYDYTWHPCQRRLILIPASCVGTSVIVNLHKNELVVSDRDRDTQREREENSERAENRRFNHLSKKTHTHTHTQIHIKSAGKKNYKRNDRKIKSNINNFLFQLMQNPNQMHFETKKNCIKRKEEMFALERTMNKKNCIVNALIDMQNSALPKFYSVLFVCKFSNTKSYALSKQYWNLGVALIKKSKISMPLKLRYILACTILLLIRLFNKSWNVDAIISFAQHHRLQS